MNQQLGDYQLVRELGRGGMGVVYEARHPNVPRPLALKLCLQGLARADDVQRFKREALVLAQVKHPNVVTIHQLLECDQGPYLVTDLVPGEPLSALMRMGPCEPLRAARICRALADALVAIHAQGVVHRDLKPANVILSDNDHPVLLDFGLARELDAETLTRTGDVLGTPAYMAPEQAGGETPSTLDGRVDVYGLGAVLFALLASRPPFAGGGVVQTIKQVLVNEPRWPSKDVAGIPPALEAICKQAMAKEPETRTPSAEALRNGLDAFLAGPHQGTERSPALPTLIAILLLGAASAAWVQTVQRPNPSGSVARPRALAPPDSKTAPKPEAVPNSVLNRLRERAEDANHLPERARVYLEACLLSRSNDGSLKLENTLDTYYRGKLLYPLVPKGAGQGTEVKGTFLNESSVLVYANQDGADVEILSPTAAGHPSKRFPIGRESTWGRGARVTCAALPRLAPESFFFSGDTQELYWVDSRTLEPRSIPELTEASNARAAGATPAVWRLSEREVGPPISRRNADFYAIAAAQDGSAVLLGGDWKEAVFLEIDDGRVQHQRYLRGHTQAVTGTAITTDGELLVTFSGDHDGKSEISSGIGTLRVWRRSEPAQPPVEVDLGGQPLAIAADPTHPTRIAVGLFSGAVFEFEDPSKPNSRRLLVAPAPAGNPLAGQTHMSSIRGVVYSSRGRLFSMSRGRIDRGTLLQEATLLAWKRLPDGSLEPGEPVYLGTTTTTVSLDVSPSGDQLVVGTREGACAVWAPPTARD
jgi:serine/threonine protein kinase